jgi:hypothetical protein
MGVLHLRENLQTPPLFNLGEHVLTHSSIAANLRDHRSQSQVEALQQCMTSIGDIVAAKLSNGALLSRCSLLGMLLCIAEDKTLPEVRELLFSVALLVLVTDVVGELVRVIEEEREQLPSMLLVCTGRSIDGDSFSHLGELDGGGIGQQGR